MVDVETFRALARSSPWLWSSIQLTRTITGEENDERVRAWLRRPGLMRVQPDDGELYVVDESRNIGQGRGAVRYTALERRPRFSLARLFGRRALPAQYRELDAVPGDDRFSGDAVGAQGFDSEFRTPQHPDAPQPLRRDDGLVLRRPDDFNLVYDDPMYENYQWVAMLDPVELADGQWPDALDEGMQDRPVGVDILELTETEHHGRRALEALVRPAPAYNPRCTCCALLFNDVTVEILREEGAPAPEPLPVFAEAHRVVLDRETGICVSLRDMGGDRDGVGLDVVIEEVDAAYPDEMFR